jgi:ATP phosphoribosyltransferase regulatory subunit
MSAWVLPDHIADVLPSEARQIEEIRRDLLDTARSYGYELVIPPLLEHLESLLSGTGEALDLQTFKLVDQLSGRTLGVRADSTPQVARIDAHLLNRQGVARLCYCGPVLHARPSGAQATREPLQFGAEIYGHSGLEADLEALTLALDVLQVAGVSQVQVDMADARVVQGLLQGVTLTTAQSNALHGALITKDGQEVASVLRDADATVRQAFQSLLQMYGDAEVLREARRVLPSNAKVVEALDAMEWLAAQVGGGTPLSFDLADLRGYAYYSGAQFSIYTRGVSESLVRGGRYDEVGSIFGRKRPAVGFGLDIKALASVVQPGRLRAAIRAPWLEDGALRETIAGLRKQGEVVVRTLPGHEQEIDEFQCDRELKLISGQWSVQKI